MGLGFMGASLAASCKRFGMGRVSAYDPIGARCSWAQSAGIVDRAYPDIAGAVKNADLVVSAAPVDRIVETLLEASRNVPGHALLTDLGSTRSMIDEQLAGALPKGVAHAGSHPLAGSEKTGPEGCSDILFVGKLVLLTPVSASEAQLRLLQGFWETLGARVETMDSVQHDRILAQTSHLPHLVAYALAQSLPGDWHNFAATGFRDTTRIAKGSPEIWGPIMHSNRKMVLEALDRFEQELARWRETLVGGDPEKIRDLVAEANQIRKAIG